MLEDATAAWQETFYSLNFDLFSFLSARVSSELSEDQKDNIHTFLKPILANFEEQSWSSTAWTKFVMLIIVCNGGTENVAQVSDQDETLQDRLVNLVTGQQIPSAMIDS